MFRFHKIKSWPLLVFIREASVFPIIIRRWKRRYIYIGHVRRLWTLFPVLNETLRYAIAIIVGCGFPYDTRRCDGQDSYVICFLMCGISAQISCFRVWTEKGYKRITTYYKWPLLQSAAMREKELVHIPEKYFFERSNYLKINRLIECMFLLQEKRHCSSTL